MRSTPAGLTGGSALQSQPFFFFFLYSKIWSVKYFSKKKITNYPIFSSKKPPPISRERTDLVWYFWLCSYSEEVAASAQAWVDNCILGHGAPSTRYELGENMFYSSAPDSWTDVINAWHAEVSRYLYPKGSSSGHYTQVVWNSSYKIGCGVALCPNSIYLYACHYYRAGNFRGWPPYKAGPPCASCPNNCEDKLCTNPCPYIDKYINCPTMKDTTGCSNRLVSSWCPASCKCTDEIIPIA
uniref:ShKT domain-containing protein n=1 Tax=Cyclopterus lumpus TaxID=8103 RepID=A0A8C3AB43_CYCLU